MRKIDLNLKNQNQKLKMFAKKIYILLIDMKIMDGYVSVDWIKVFHVVVILDQQQYPHDNQLRPMIMNDIAYEDYGQYHLKHRYKHYVFDVDLSLSTKKKNE